MVEKLNYKKYINYLYEVTEVADSTRVENMIIEREKDKETADYIVDIEYDQTPVIDDIGYEPTDTNENIADNQDSVATKPLESTMSRKTGTKPLENVISNKTRTEIVYKPDPDIDIEEFKQEPMNVSELLSSLSSETNSFENETFISEPRNTSSESRTEIVYKPDPDIDIFKHELSDVEEDS